MNIYAVILGLVVVLLLVNLVMLLVNWFTQFRVCWIFAWYDFWVGFYWDRQHRVLYFFPIPMIGFQLIFPSLGPHVYEAPS